MFGFLEKRPSAGDVAERLLILRYQVVHALAAPPAGVLESLSSSDRVEVVSTFRDYARRTCAALQADGLWGKLSTGERTFFSTPGAELDRQAHLNALWRLEAAGCLMWALRLIPELPPYDIQFDLDALKVVAPDGAWAFVRAAVLRSSAEIEAARDVAELWHWRSRTRELQEKGFELRTELGSLDEIVRRAATRAAEAGDFPTVIRGDFPAFGKPYRELDQEEWSVVRSIAVERHFAFNWMCGEAPRNRWEDTPTDT